MMSDLVESRMEDFIKLRLSQMTEKERRLAQSMIGGRKKTGKGEEDELERDKDLFKISKKEDEYFTKMSDQEQMRLYTTLHDQNTRLKEHIKTLKKEFMTLMQKIEGKELLDMQMLQDDNKILRDELRQLTFKNDRVGQEVNQEANTKMSIPAKQKRLLKAYGGSDKPVEQPALLYVDHFDDSD